MRARSTPSLSPEQLRQDHSHLEQHFEDLIRRATLGDWKDCDAIWDRFGRELEAHMRYEEAELLPDYADSSPEAAAVAQQLRAEHTIIRQLLDGIGLDIQLHAVRAVGIRRFVSALRAHSEREDKTLYPWLRARAKPPAASRPEPAATGARPPSC
jgi:hemerythrin superfamily protein